MSGSDIASVNEWEDVATEPGHAPTAIKPLKV